MAELPGIERETLDVDVVIVGAGPAGLAVARDLLDAVRELAAGAYLVPPFKEPEAVLELLA